jgi:hypothetical protein
MGFTKPSKSNSFSAAFTLMVIFVLTYTDQAYSQRRLPGLKTNTSKSTIDLKELQRGGPGKDGIPPIDKPVFIDQKSAQKWLRSNEPVISLAINDQSKAYPLQILMWHEIVNDTLAGVPVAVTFCPLCYSANVFDRKINGKSYSFGISGMLRHSDMVMYDHQTESLWQQISGEAIVGDMVGSQLKRIPAQIIYLSSSFVLYIKMDLSCHAKRAIVVTTDKILMQVMMIYLINPLCTAEKRMTDYCLWKKLSLSA